MIKHLIEFEFTATHRFANEDIYINDVLYQGKLLGEVGISAMMPDSFYGIEEPQSVTIKLANVDGYFTALVNSEELRGKTVYIRQNEDGTNIESWRGAITSHDITDEASFTILLKNPDPFQVRMSKQTLTTGLWSNVPEKNLGKPFPLAIGYCERVPCLYAGEDKTSNYYDYIIGHGPIESLTKLYRAGIEIAGTEYIFYDGSQSFPYAGYAFVRFTKEQRDFSNSLFDIAADVHGLKMGGALAQRNFVRVIQNLLSNSTWGLGLTVNATSFDIAASAVIDNSAGTMAGLLCDGDINMQEKAQDILDKLLYACRGSLSTNLNGQYEISIDTYKATSSATFGSGDGYYDNIVSIKSRRKSATNQAFKTFTLKYRKNNDKEEFKQKLTRSVFSFGEDRVVESPFVSVSDTADRIACYRQKRALNADEMLELEVGREGKSLKAGDRVTIIIPRMGINSAAYQVEAVQRNLTTFSLALRSYAPAIYDYTAGSLPADETLEIKKAATPFVLGTSLLVQFLNGTTRVDCLISLGGGILLAGTDWGLSARVMKSIDNGNTWSISAPLGFNTQVNCLLSLGAGVVLAGTGTGSGEVWKSADSGTTWTKIQQLGSTWDVHCLVSLGNGVVLSGTGMAGNIYKSTDSGATWTPIQQLGSAVGVMSMVSLGNGVVLAGTNESGSIWRSADSGASWTLIQPTAVAVRAFINLGDNIVLAGVGNSCLIFRSVDNGLTWRVMGTVDPSQTYILCFADIGNGVVLAGTGGTAGKIFKSINYGITWTQVQPLASELYVNTMLNMGDGRILAGTYPSGQIYNIQQTFL